MPGLRWNYQGQGKRRSVGQRMHNIRYARTGYSHGRRNFFHRSKGNLKGKGTYHSRFIKKEWKNRKGGIHRRRYYVH